MASDDRPSGAVRKGLPHLLVLLAALGGCANAPRPTLQSPPVAQAEARCRNIAYENRRIVGRGPPNWNFYDYCMRQFEASRE